MKKVFALALMALIFSTPALAAYNQPGEIKPFKIVGKQTQGHYDTSNNDTGATGRIAFKAKGDISSLRLLMRNNNSIAGYEVNGLNPVIQRASIEYPSGITPLQVSVKGSTTWVVDNKAPFVESDSLGVIIPAGQTFYVNFHTRVSAPPTSPAVSAVSGGALTTGTTYFYKVTAIDNSIESTGSSEVSCAASSPNLSCSLSWTENANASGYNIYRGTATGAETYLTSIRGKASGYIDTGSIILSSTATPPTQQKMYFGYVGNTGDSGNSQYLGGNGLDTTETGGALTGVNTPSGTSAIVGQYIVVANDTKSHPWLGIGDSIQTGTGFVDDYNATEGSARNLNYFNAGFVDGTDEAVLNYSISGAKAVDFAANARSARTRLALLPYADKVLTNLCHNDLAAGTTWTQCASYLLTMGKQVHSLNKKFYITTHTPSGTSTDNFITVGSQTKASWESARVNLNTWVRLRSPVDSSGNPVLTGGVPSPYIDGYFDEAKTVEVNSSNVLTDNGGYWLSPSSAYSGPYTLTGSPTATSLPVSGSPWGGKALNSFAVKMLTGGAAGQTAQVESNAAGTLTLYADGVSSSTGVGTYRGLTVIPSAGDTFELYKPTTNDGVHPSNTGYRLMGPAFYSWRITK